MVEETKETLPPAEFDVLTCLRNFGPVTARRVREELQGYRPMTHGAVVTLLIRLEKRGLVRREKGPVGKAFLFEAVKADRPIRNSLKSLLKRVFQGDEVAFVASLFETRPPTLVEIDQLQELLDEMREKRRKEKK
jgi:BlaI family transcriptional regulator, penicillinase repressor